MRGTGINIINKLYLVNLGGLAIAELIAFLIFQAHLGYEYSALFLSMDCLFVGIATCFCMRIGKWFDANAVIMPRKYSVWKMLTAVVILLCILPVFVSEMQKTLKLQLMLRVAILYLIRLAAETWSVVHYQKHLTAKEETIC